MYVCLYVCLSVSIPWLNYMSVQIFIILIEMKRGREKLREGESE
jgi:hypothetical protein